MKGIQEGERDWKKKNQGEVKKNDGGDPPWGGGAMQGVISYKKTA